MDIMSMVSGVSAFGGDMAGAGASYLLDKKGWSTQRAKYVKTATGDLSGGSASYKGPTMLTSVQVTPEMRVKNEHYNTLKALQLGQSAANQLSQDVMGGGGVSDAGTNNIDQTKKEAEYSKNALASWQATQPKTDYGIKAGPTSTLESKQLNDLIGPTTPKEADWTEPELSTSASGTPEDNGWIFGKSDPLGPALKNPTEADFNEDLPATDLLSFAGGSGFSFGGFAKEGIKSSNQPNMKVVDFKRINKGIPNVDTTPVKVDGKPVLAAKGEFKVILEDDKGKKSEAILNVDQWRQYLNGRNINSILAELPKLNETQKAADGIVGPYYVDPKKDDETPFLSMLGDKTYTEATLDEIFPGRKKDVMAVKDKPDQTKLLQDIFALMMKQNADANTIVETGKNTSADAIAELEKNAKTTKDVNLARSISNAGLSMAGIINNLTTDYDVPPLSAPHVAGRHVTVRPPNMDDKHATMDAAYISALRMAMETGQSHMIAPIHANFMKAVEEFNAGKYNAESDATMKGESINAEIGSRTDTTNAQLQADADTKNMQMQQWVSQLKDANKQKTFQMMSDIGNTATTARKLNADADLSVALAKYKMSQDEMDRILQLLYKG